MRPLRILAVGAVLALLLTVTVPPRPANAVFLWYGANYNGGLFQHLDGTPFMTQQELCIYCVASATVAWIDFVRVVHTNDYGWRFTQQEFWNNYFSVPKTYSGWNTDLIFRCSPDYYYNRRAINASQDDGVDPYGAAWGIFDKTPGGYYYNQNVYSTGVYNGVSWATHGVALSLATYSEPAGVVIDNGGHYVLVSRIEADEDPRVNFWTPLRKVLVRDPLKPIGAQEVVYRYDLNEWNSALTPYGWEGGVEQPKPYCGPLGTNCRDEIRASDYAGNLWWGRYVTVQRNSQGFTPDTFFIWDD